MPLRPMVVAAMALHLVASPRVAADEPLSWARTHS
jgi:hypothetical protein